MFTQEKKKSHKNQTAARLQEFFFNENSSQSGCSNLPYTMQGMPLDILVKLKFTCRRSWAGPEVLPVSQSSMKEMPMLVAPAAA